MSDRMLLLWLVVASFLSAESRRNGRLEVSRDGSETCRRDFVGQGRSGGGGGGIAFCCYFFFEILLFVVVVVVVVGNFNLVVEKI